MYTVRSLASRLSATSERRELDERAARSATRPSYVRRFIGWTRSSSSKKPRSALVRLARV